MSARDVTSLGFTPVRELPCVEGFRCESDRCHSVHWICPYCQHEGSIHTNKVTAIFSCVCHENQNSMFLVDGRPVFYGVQPVSVQ